MISVVILRNEKGVITGFDSNGHAGYARRGEDIVCAAFSMLVINTINSIEAFTDSDFTCQSSEKDGSIVCRFPSGTDERAQLLLDAMLLGMESIRDEYGEGYINIRIEEV